MRKFISILLVVIFATACRPKQINFKEEEEKITFAWTDWSKKALTGKPDSIAYYFADNAIVIMPNMKPIYGKAEMIKFYAAAPADFELDIKWENDAKPNIIEFSKDGDMAYSLDRNEIPEPDSSGKIQMIPNKVIHVWKKDNDGNWRVSLLMVSPE